MKILLLLLIACPCLAQTENLYFIKKHAPLVFNTPDYQPGKKAFYIYRNCVYSFVLTNKLEISVHVVDIKNDLIYYTLPPSPDTLTLAPSRLKKIRLIADRTVGIVTGVSLKRRWHVFVKSPAPKEFERRIDTVDSIAYELVPYLTYQGISRVYQQCNKTYYYEGIAPVPCKDSVKTSKPPIVKNWAWFTPSNANIIKGLNIGVETMHMNDEPLTIQGVNLNAGILSFFVNCYALFSLPIGNNLINLEDTVDKSKTSIWVKGVSISAGGLMGDMEVTGFSVNGAICGITKTKGLVITGMQNLSDDFSGAAITGLRNRAIKGKGMQVGLLNICKHLKGVQIGLWNVNSKRRLPFINWSF